MEISGGMQDEIKAHLDGHFISPTEACWKIFEFNMHRESPAVQHLPIHLSNEHYVNFHAHQIVNKVLARQNVEKTQLTAWFDYNCQEHVEQEQSDPEWSRITLEWKGVDNKSGEQPWP